MTTKKRFQFHFSLLLMLIFGGVMASCSDKDGGSLDEPKYEQDAARFTITSSDSPYSSIELTASGNYIITEKDNTPYYAATRSNSNFMRSGIFTPKTEAPTRDSYYGIIYGKYTKTSDGVYKLEGFGTIKVESKGGKAVDLDITTNSGKSIVVGANRDNIMSESDMTNKLCRTWKFTKVHVIYWEDGKKLFDKTLSMDQFWEMEEDNYDDDYEDYDERPENVIFTKAGTYMVTYKNGTLAVSTWRWENEKKGILRYSWDYDHLNDPDESGTVSLRFDGNKLIIIEEDEDEDYGEKYLFEWYLEEV